MTVAFDTGDSAAAVLRPLMRDAAVDIKAVSAGGNLRIVPGAEYTPRCVDRLARMREGVMSMGSALLAQGVDGNLYVRELGPRGEVLLQEHPERPVYLLAPSGPRFGAPPVFTRLDPDSLRRSWAAARY